MRTKGTGVCLKNVLLLYKKLVDDLESHGFEINPYGQCVENKIVEGNQLMITWHAENLKILHVDRKVLLSTILWLEPVYNKMNGTRRKRHE